MVEGLIIPVSDEDTDSESQQQPAHQLVTVAGPHEPERLGEKGVHNLSTDLNSDLHAPQNPGEGSIEAQEDGQNYESLSPSSSSPAIRPVTENVVTPGDVAAGSVAIDQRVKDLVEDFWKFHLNWINNAAQEVCISLPSGISGIAHFQFWSEVVGECS